MTFNAAGYTLSDTRALGETEEQTTVSTRPVTGNFIGSSTDALQAQTAYVRDAFGNATAVTRCLPGQNPCTEASPGALTTHYTYDPRFEDVATITDPLNHTTTYGYDAAGNLTSVTDPLQHQTTFGYNAQGQLTSVTDALQHQTTFTYAGGDLTTVTDPLQHQTRRFTDAGGRVLNVTDPLGQITRYTYDRNNQVLSLTDALGGITAFTYDPDGHLQTVTDAKQHATQYGYDPMGRLASRADPLNRTEGFTYDLLGNPATWTDRKGQVTTRTYDALDRLSQITYDDLSTITYMYDARDRVSQIDDSQSGSIARTYDDFDRLASETTPQGSISYTYDDAGRRATMTVTGQPAVVYTYDDADRLTGLTRDTLSVGMTYDEVNRRATLTLLNGIVTEYGYDDNNQLTSIEYRNGATTLGDLTYTYDAAGRRTQIGGSWARTGLPQALVAATYDAADELVQWGAETRQFDATGNLASDGLTSYTWDARGRLISIAGTSSRSAEYDSIGRRTASTANGIATAYLYDRDNIASETTNAQSSILLSAGLDVWLARIDAAGSQSILTDALGSVTGLVSSGSVIATKYTYSPFGGTTVNGISANEIRFTGREDDGAERYFVRARYYDSGSGRFMSEDALRTSPMSSLYTYVDDSPTNATDPSGLFKVCCRDVASMAYTLCHCWISLSDGHTIGAYRDFLTLTRRQDFRDDRPTPPGSCCKEYGGGKAEDDVLRNAWNAQPLVGAYGAHNTSNTAVSEALRMKDIALPPCAEGRHYYWDIFTHSIRPIPR